MPRRLHLSDRDRSGIVELHGREVVIAGTGTRLVVRREPEGRFTVEDSGLSLSGAAAVSGDVVWVFVDGETFEIHVGTGAAAHGDVTGGALSPPMPSTVVRIPVHVGQTVARGDLVVALEAMKMELPIRAPRDGVVRAIHCREGELVQPGTRLVEIE